MSPESLHKRKMKLGLIRDSNQSSSGVPTPQTMSAKSSLFMQAAEEKNQKAQYEN